MSLAFSFWLPCKLDGVEAFRFARKRELRKTRGQFCSTYIRGLALAMLNVFILVCQGHLCNNNLFFWSLFWFVCFDFFLRFFGSLLFRGILLACVFFSLGFASFFRF